MNSLHLKRLAIDFNFLGSTVEKVLDQMESFRTSVMERI